MSSNRIDSDNRLRTIYQIFFNNLTEFKNNGYDVDADKIKEYLDFCCTMPNIEISFEEKELIRKRIETEITQVEDNVSSYLLDPYTLENSHWVEKEKNNIIWNHWNAYRKQFNSRPVQKLKISEDTNRILSFIENPKREGKWDIRGLVVGDVQAGKTANYIGLITKAIDAGYKIIIVLAGITNDLRKQTQQRIDMGVLGYITDKQKITAPVNRIVSGVKVDYKTTSAIDGDYKKEAFRASNIDLSGSCALYVVKKNVSVLKNIYFDIMANIDTKTGKVPFPLLMIDDEADNASINTKQERYDSVLGKDVPESEINVSTINMYIRGILNKFDRSSYVGYTATPFANILGIPDLGRKTCLQVKGRDSDFELIEVGEDLFPRNFIYYIEPPRNYYGPEKVFGISESDDEEKLPIVVDIEQLFPGDIENSIEIQESTGKKRKIKTRKFIRMPESLKYAIDYFFVSAACKQLRQADTPHNTMLIHVERLVESHNDLKCWVEKYVKSKKDLFIIACKEKRELYFDRLHSIWENEWKRKHPDFCRLCDDDSLTPLDWDDVREKITSLIPTVECKIVNGLIKGEGLNYDDYKNGRNVIAIGGDKLSRGLTLFGLIVSYFLRPSKMFDSLAQMGRWFGYRDGYIDMCRIFSTTEIAKSYTEIARANYYLKIQFQDLYRQEGKTPKDYGLRITTSADSQMLVTAINKQHNAEKLKISYSKNAVSTAYIPKDEKILDHNYGVMKKFISLLGTPDHSEKHKNAIYWSNVSSGLIASEFFGSSFKLGGIQSVSFSMESVRKYIEKLNSDNNEITSWTVMIPRNGDGTRINLMDDFANEDFTLTMSKRSVDSHQDYWELNRRALLSGGYEAFDLTDEERNKAIELTNMDRKKKGKEFTNTPSPMNIRNCRSRQKALLILYILELTDDDKKIVGSRVPAFLVSFPGTSNKDSTVEFVCNKVDYLAYLRMLDEEAKWYGGEDE